MFQLHKDVFSLTSTHNIMLADNWQEDIANHLRDLVRLEHVNNRYVVWYRSNDTPKYIFIVSPVEDRHYVYLGENLCNETGNGLREVLAEEGDLSKYILCSNLRAPEEFEGVTFQGVAIDIPESVTDAAIMQFIGSAGEEVIRHRKTLPPGQRPVLFLTGKFTEEDIDDLEQNGFVLGNLLYKF